MLIIAIVIPLAVGGLSTLISGGTKASFEKPPLSPPDWLFPVVWTILYVMIGIASYLIYKESEYKFNDALKAYCYQLFVNFCWPIVFFRFEYYTAAAIVLGDTAGNLESYRVLQAEQNRRTAFSAVSCVVPVCTISEHRGCRTE